MQQMLAGILNIRVFYKTFDNRIIEVKTKTVDYVRVIVEMFAKEFGK